MSFDRTNPSHLQALQNEVITDPFLNGYVPDGPTQELLNKLNTSGSDLANQSGEDSLIAGKLLTIIYAENIGSQDQFKLQLLFEATNGLQDDVSDFKAEVSALSVSLASAITANIRVFSVAERLFSVQDVNNSYDRVVLSREDWFAARDYVGA